MPSSDSKVTAASEWRRPPEGFEVELPSRKVAYVRRTLDIMSMMSSGKIPNILKGVVAEAVKAGDASKINIDSLDPESIMDMFSMVDQIVIGMMLNPKVLPDPERQAGEEEWVWRARVEGTDPPDGYIWLSDIEPEDKMFLFNVAQGGTTEVAKFREEQGGSMGTLLNGEAVPDTPKRSAGTRKGK